MEIQSTDLNDTLQLGEKLGHNLRGGEVIELKSDLGGGKTALTKGIAKGVGISVEEVSSPSFVICNTYEAKSFTLYHYDLYRLQELGIISDELGQSVGQNDIVTIIEWAGAASDILPKNRIVVTIEKSKVDEYSRTFIFSIPANYNYIAEGLN